MDGKGMQILVGSEKKLLPEFYATFSSSLTQVTPGHEVWDPRWSRIL